MGKEQYHRSVINPEPLGSHFLAVILGWWLSRQYAEVHVFPFCKVFHLWGGGQGGRPLPPPAPLPPPPAPSSLSSLLERRALRARKTFLFPPSSLSSSPLLPPAPSSPSSRPLFSLLPPPLLPPPARSSPSSLPLFSPSRPLFSPSRPLFSPSLLPCPPPHLY